MEKRISPWKLAGAFFAVYFIWGTTYLASLFGLEGMGPFVLSALRYGSAAILLGIWVFARKLHWPARENFPRLVLSGALMLVGGSGLVVYGEQYVNSGYAAVVVASEPLWFVILDRKRWSFYFGNWKIIAGLLTGFGGIILFSFYSSGNAELRPGGILPGTLIILGSAVLWVVGTLIAAGITTRQGSNIARTTVQLISGAIVASLIAAFTGEWTTFAPALVSDRAWAGLAFLVIMGSIVAYVSFNWLVTVRPPALVSTHTYVNPVVAVLLGWTLAGELLSGRQVAALFIVLAGIAITQIQHNKKPAVSN
ncbi:MAG: EamA family transporter [Chitinophagaceae bacterium]|nr:MAG: EamA family transporter [Chitinophagaceae bacterium]